MKEKIQRIQRISNNLIRLVTNEDTSYKIYLYWAALTVLLVGVFGIYPFTRELIGKYQISRQMVELNKKLSKKFNEVSDVSEKIKMVGGDISYIDNYLPEDFDIQNYMIDFITVAGKAGYYIDAFTPLTQEGTAIEISVGLFGEGNLAELTGSLENMNRVSEIQDVRLSRGGVTDILRLSIKTYIMEKQ